jgi:membrane-bound serine protease (ClpP class)
MRKRPALRALRAAYLSFVLLGSLMLATGGALDTGSAVAAPPGQSGANPVVEIGRFDLPITPISAQYYDRLIKSAEDDGASALVIQLDTPGGLVDSMQDMVQRTLSSRVPVIVYVSPQGAMATSAGVFIVFASHVAAMAPNSTIGSSEVLLNAGNDQSGQSTPESGDTAALRRKTTNLLVSLIRNLADQRGRNADFAEKAVRESANLGAQAALEQKVVDIVAPTLDDLIRQADGRTVDLNGQKEVLKLKGATLREVPLTWVEEVLLVLTNPSVAFVLISLGTLGLTWEFINPGAVFPGVVGAIMLLIGFLALGTLPINAAGLAFLALAFVLFIADVFMPTHGILTAGGIVSLVLGGLLLVNTGAAPGVPGVSPFAITGVATGLGAFFFFAVYKVYKARMSRPTTGREGLVGALAETRSALAPEGMVFVDGELWHATSVAGPVSPGVPVRVVAADGLLLKVEPATAGGDAANVAATTRDLSAAREQREQTV